MRVPTYSNAQAKIKKWIFHVKFPGFWIEFGIFLNDFSSSVVWAFQIKLHSVNSKILKILEFNQNMNRFIKKNKTFELLEMSVLVEMPGNMSEGQPLTNLNITSQLDFLSNY